MFPIRFAGLLAALFLSPAVQAFYCFEPSPTYLQLGEDYFTDTSNRIVVEGDEPGLEVVENLQGEWEGYLSEIICEGDQEAPEPIYREAEVEADVKDSNTALFLISMSKTYRDSFVESESVYLMNKGSMYSLRINDSFISASERERRSLQGKLTGSRHVEVFSQIEIENDDQITVDWQLFSNGVFVYSQRLTLERDL
ncbi:hypothetical protein [Methylophaga sp.]|uniref:hypothetical protein n=1 Tax=Methylophaga sp. TaxID=2024840 RepID=UPI0013FE6611|nr:hypothetical protein [Methylophaga sp.]MTI62892.1 hypothetical protein [Methylophaga sp.]